MIFESGLSKPTTGASVYISEYRRAYDKILFVQIMATFHCLSSIFKFVTDLGDIYHIAQSKVIYLHMLFNYLLSQYTFKKIKFFFGTGLPVFYSDLFCWKLMRSM